MTERISAEEYFEQVHGIISRNTPVIFLGSQYSEYIAQRAFYLKTRFTIRKSQTIHKYLSPFEDWYIPIDFQR